MSGLFYYKIIFMAELLCSELFFVSRLHKKSHFVWRMIGAFVVNMLFAALFPLLVKRYNALYISAMFIIMFFFSVLTMKFCFDDSFLSVLFCCIAGYSVQHIAYEVYNFILVAMNIGEVTIGIYGEAKVEISAFFSNPLVLVLYLCTYIALYTAGYFIFAAGLKKGEEFRLKNMALFVIVMMIIFVDVVMNAFVMEYALGMQSASDEKVLRLISGVYNVFCCALALYIQFEVAIRKNLEQELDTVKHLRYIEREQYKSSKENIELINMKCHDIKHQIASIGKSKLMSSEYIEELNDVISIYDSAIATGNQTLDVILTEKSLLCNKNKIKFSCIVDGARLGFMNEGDIYSLFGNLVDNAIEAVCELEEDMRTIGIKVNVCDDELVINETNYYEKPLIYENGVLQTTKPDKKYHGFGFKSIKYICDKYGGSIIVDTHDKIFDITIKFPITPQAAQ